MAIDPLVYRYVTSEERYDDKGIIIKQGSVGEWLYVVIEGKVKVKKKSSTGMITIDTLEEGNIFGEMVFLEGVGERSATVIADGPAVVGSLNMQQIRQDWAAVSPQLSDLVKKLSKRLYEGTNKLMAAIIDIHGSEH